DWQKAHVLFVTVKDPSGNELWTWSYDIHPVRYQQKKGAGKPVRVRETPEKLIVNAGQLEMAFDTSTGLLQRVEQNGKGISFTNGPRFIGARRGDRSLDRWMEENLPVNVDRIYPEITDRMELM